jgi:hypothetical protein
MHILLAAVLASASLAAAQTPIPYAAPDQFWWSVPSVPTEDLQYYYAAVVAPCGNGSCAACAPEAKPCSGQQWSNLCYEPTEGERCCEDPYGSG